MQDLSFSAPLAATLAERIWSDPYAPLDAMDESIPVHFDIHAALSYARDMGDGSGPPVTISAASVQAAAEALEDKIRRSWRADGSVRLVGGPIDIHM